MSSRHDTLHFLSTTEQPGEYTALFAGVAPLGELKDLTELLPEVTDVDRRRDIAEAMGAVVIQRGFPDEITEGLTLRLAAHTVPDVHEFMDEPLPANG